MTLLQWEIILWIVLFLYWVGRLLRDRYCYRYFTREMKLMVHVLHVSSCSIEKEGDNIYYDLYCDDNISRKDYRAIVDLFDDFYQGDVIVSDTEEGKPFIPYFKRDNLEKVMNTLLLSAASAVADYAEQDFLASYFLKRSYDALLKSYQPFAEKCDAVSQMKPGSVFHPDLRENEKEVKQQCGKC